VIYHGWLQSTGKLFDSSYLHGLTYQVQNIGQAQVISGWNIGLIGMKVGGTRRLIIPPSLGYGAQGSPPTIPANATLIFDITLVSIDS
jgi:peptidylprolyl isomerase